MDEQFALQFVERAQGALYRYMGNEEMWKGDVGRFERLDNLNCCAPENNVLFAFVTDERRKVMDAKGLLAFSALCQKI